MKQAFTMVELIFVIVILGIIASVALPRLAGSKEDAEITRAKAQIAAIRTGIQTTRGANLLAQNSQNSKGYPEELDEAEIEKITNGTKLGSNWSVSENKLSVTISGARTTFTYSPSNGKLTCPNSDELCKKIDN